MKKTGKKVDPLADQKFWGVSLLQWLGLMALAGTALTLLLRHFFG